MSEDLVSIANRDFGELQYRLTPSETLALCRVLKCTLEELAGEIEKINKD